MGTGKKEASRKERQGKTGDGMANVKTKGENFYRDAKKVRSLNRLKEGKAQRNARGEITQAATFQSREVPNARIEPNRKWFTNSRVISQEALSSFRDAVAKQTSNPNTFLLKTNKLPMSLIRDDPTPTVNGLKRHHAKMVVETSSYGDTFGPKAQRKRVKIGLDSFSALASESTTMHDSYLDRLEQARLLRGNADSDAEIEDLTNGQLAAPREAIFTKGQSRRIWNELYKVMDSSDVIIHVLDARDPLGTRCRAVEKYLREEAPHKHLVFVLNKCDLVPTSVAAKWVKALSLEYPTLAFHASITNSFGKGSLIALLRQFAILHADRKQISAGFIGYPNAGKSSIINTLRKKMVCKTAPIPGETKVWQYITLTRRIYLIDCPGVVPPNASDSEQDILLRGVVRVEAVENPAQYVAAALAKCQKRHVERTYELKEWETPDQFLELLARKTGKLLKGGEADYDAVARMVLHDFLRGKLPWYTPPPTEGGEEEGKTKDGRLGEMKKQRLDKEGEGVEDAGEDSEEFGAVDPADIGNLDEEFTGFSDEESGSASEGETLGEGEDGEEGAEDAEEGEGDEAVGEEDEAEGEQDEAAGEQDEAAVEQDTAAVQQDETAVQEDEEPSGEADSPPPPKVAKAKGQGKRKR
ncbi:nucleolar GTP-binding protein [Trichodelitschia bisporula]|uniref:Nucleolar GTP-binding protein 2 n=1 Tax=Trichodelitschia bisporula TaxID=703511 RepID=A0A6G1I3N9_9PEZI|nr:nucleolar GTP-binding protein [Trichodelitschia bisporula]